MNILAIESSCDETAAAVVADGRRVLSSAVLSQIDLHALYGGVVPEIASRRHLESVVPLVDRALAEAGLEKKDLDALAVTCAPGLIGALLVGVSFAKAAAYALGLPLVPVHHIKGHIASAYLAFPELAPPFVCLAVSGGNTLLLHVKSYTDVKTLGSTRDDAAGEAFDKAARVLGIPYPGGKEIDRLARQGREERGLEACLRAYPLPRPSFADAPFDTSFSGLKTAVVNLAHREAQKGREPDKPALAASLCEAVADMLAERALAASRRTKLKTLVVCGGVAANSRLRERLTEEAKREGVSLFIPPPALCGDNAAMIASQAYYEYLSGVRAPLDLNASAQSEL